MRLNSRKSSGRFTWSCARRYIQRYVLELLEAQLAKRKKVFEWKQQRSLEDLLVRQ